MKKNIIICILMMIAPLFSFAQEKEPESMLDSLRIALDSLGIDPDSNTGRTIEWMVYDLNDFDKVVKNVNYNVETPRYRLYPTTNIWTFIKLDTRNGCMWQVQFSVDGEKHRFETILNLYPLVSVDEGVDGRFTLIATQNSYNFILLDQYNGMTYQTQWSQDPDERFVTPISTGDTDSTTPKKQKKRDTDRE